VCIATHLYIYIYVTMVQMIDGTTVAVPRLRSALGYTECVIYMFLTLEALCAHTKMVGEGVPKALVQALSNHPDSAEVAKSACRAIMFLGTCVCVCVCL